MTESKLTISWEKEGHIFCDFRFSSSFQKIDMILLTRPEGGLIGLIILIQSPGKTKAGCAGVHLGKHDIRVLFRYFASFA